MPATTASCPSTEPCLAPAGQADLAGGALELNRVAYGVVAPGGCPVAQRGRRGLRVQAAEIRRLHKVLT